MKYLRPSLRESDMPHRTKTHGEIMDRAQRVVDRVKEKLEVRHSIFLMSISCIDVIMNSTSTAKYR